MIIMKPLRNSELGRIAEIDRSEHVTLGYVYRDGRLETEEVDWQVPRWPMDGDWGITTRIEQSKPILADGGVLLGALDGELLVGYAMEPEDIHMIKTL